jgi:hypothetical protein
MGGEGHRQMPETLTVDMPDGSTWGVPVMLIARSRAEHYKGEFGGDIERSLAEDTVPLFSESDYEIKDWARGNMNWSDVQSVAVCIKGPKPMTADDMQEAWVNGETDTI